jgi:hypothetical protein
VNFFLRRDIILQANIKLDTRDVCSYVTSISGLNHEILYKGTYLDMHQLYMQQIFMANTQIAHFMSILQILFYIVYINVNTNIEMILCNC